MASIPENPAQRPLGRDRTIDLAQDLLGTIGVVGQVLDRIDLALSSERADDHVAALQYASRTLHTLLGDDPAPRCEATRYGDGGPCEGPIDAIRIVDRTGEAVTACVRHGALLLAHVDGSVVKVAAGPVGSAIDCYQRAQLLRAHGQEPMPEPRAASTAARYDVDSNLHGDAALLEDAARRHLATRREAQR